MGDILKVWDEGNSIWIPIPAIQGAQGPQGPKGDKGDTGNFSPLDAYPVGAFYISAVNSSPAGLFGGEWLPIEDTFLLAAGSTYAAGSTGGEATHLLTGAESGQKALTITGGAHAHEVKYRNDLNTATSGSNRRFGPYAYASTGSQYSPAGTSSETHTHSVSASDAASAHNNMPPYLAVYVWQRVA